ncbi:MAG: TlpA disulfide reductase family protein [Rikenellaceae bacterium]
MKLRIVLILLLCVAILGGFYYVETTRLVIKGELLGLSDNRIYLELYESQQTVRLDSVDLDDKGRFRFVVKSAVADPMLYTLVCGWERIPLMCGRGERVVVVGDGESPSGNYRVEGSQESELLRSFYQPFLEQSRQLRRVSAKYARAQSRGDDVKEYADDYSRLYRETKQQQMRFIVENKGRMASIYALMQLLPGDNYLFSRTSDLIYKRTVVEGVSQNYPNSNYLVMLRRDIDRQEKQDSLMSQISYVDFPELSLPDMYGEKVSLSSLKGRVVLLDFWSAELGSSNQNNAELKQLYKLYGQMGFEVYQVGIDTSRSVWLTSVQKQRLPWISVSDLRGGNSPALGLYNVTQLPSNVLINKDGVIVGRDLYGDDLKRALAGEMARSINY